MFGMLLMVITGGNLSNFVYTNSYILDCNPGPLSFVVGDENDRP